MTHQLSKLQGSGETWWQSALGAVKKTAYQFEFQNYATGFSEVQVLLMESTRTRLTPRAWHYLWPNGCKTFRDPAVGYSILTFLAEQQQQDRS